MATIDTDVGKAAGNPRDMEVNVGNARSVITDKATHVLKTGQAKLGSVIIWGAGTSWTLDFYDNTSAANPIWSWVTATGLGIYPLQIPCYTGLTCVSGGTTAGSCTVVWAD